VSELRQRLCCCPSSPASGRVVQPAQPGSPHGLRTAEISQATGKGTHDRRGSCCLRKGGYLADTRAQGLTLWDIEPDELDAYFR
jgi:hypothetical protein